MLRPMIIQTIMFSSVQPSSVQQALAGQQRTGHEHQAGVARAVIRVFQVALELGDPGEDVGLASLQDEARQALPKAHLADWVVGSATRPVDDTGRR